MIAVPKLTRNQSLVFDALKAADEPLRKSVV